MKLIPPNYGMVEARIHRSAMPRASHLPFLQTLGLRVCVILDDAPDPAFMEWLRSERVTVVAPLSEGSDVGLQDGHLPEQAVTRVVGMMLLAQNLPLLVVDAMGRYRTGVVVGCLRKVQRWNLTMILEEYRRFAGSRSRATDEEFLETFDTELVQVPRHADGSRAHPFVAFE